MLWTALLAGLSLVIFESLTQYFSVSSLQGKVELLNSLRQVEGARASEQIIESMHSTLVDEAQSTFEMARNPTQYLLGVLVRFFQGAYLVLPLFYLFFKCIGLVIRNATNEMKEDENTKKMAVFLGSLVFSGATWMATILGTASALWNKSDSLLVSWIAFPIGSVAVLAVVVIWLMVLSILVRETKAHKGVKANNP